MGAVGSHCKHDLKIVRFPTFSDELMCVFLESGPHLASGAEWEPSGADTKTYMVRKECVGLVMS